MRNCFSILIILACSAIYAQDSGTLRGQITDREMGDEPLIMAQVTLKNSDLSTQTNFHGNFEFGGLQAGGYTLVVSYPGYESLELDISIKEGVTTDIQNSLYAKSINMDEIMEASYSSSVGTSIPGGSSNSFVQSQ